MSASNPVIAQTLLQIEFATRVFHMGEVQVGLMNEQQAQIE